MKRTLLAAGAALTAIAALGAYAHAEERRERREVRIERVTERMGRIDANSDGFVNRAEAQAEAARMFDELDGDKNGKLDAADHANRRVIVHRMEGGRGKGGHHDRDVEVIVREGEGEGGQHTVIERREVRVREGAPKDGGPAAAPEAPRPPHPPHPPMGFMMLMSSDEADRNGDGALSKDEFVAQQLRFFDASDANGDGKIKFDPPKMPEPPEPPTPPTPPQPPRR